MLRWPGIALVSVGLVCLLLGALLENTLPQRITGLVEDQLIGNPEVPVSIALLARDLVETFSHELARGIGDPAWALALAGGILLACSVLIDLIARDWSGFDRPRLRFFRAQGGET